MDAHPTPALLVLREPDRIATLMDPDRRRLLDALQEAPDSATGLARRLEDRRQRVNYHLRILEEAGLVELAEERPRRGVTERVMRPVARRFAVDSSALGDRLAPEPTEDPDRFSATYLVALAARTIREVAGLMERARTTGKRLPSLGLTARVCIPDPARLEAFQRELADAVAGVVARHHDETGEGRCFRVTTQSYPAPSGTKEDDDEPDDEEER
jgi:DNA-binding transcriptional ArsR family regulator